MMSEVDGSHTAGEMTVRTLIFHYRVSRERRWVRMDLVVPKGVMFTSTESEQHRTFLEDLIEICCIWHLKMSRHSI